MDLTIHIDHEPDATTMRVSSDVDIASATKLTDAITMSIAGMNTAGASSTAPG